MSSGGLELSQPYVQQGPSSLISGTSDVPVDKESLKRSRSRNQAEPQAGGTSLDDHQPLSTKSQRTSMERASSRRNLKVGKFTLVEDAYGIGDIIDASKSEPRIVWQDTVPLDLRKTDLGKIELGARDVYFVLGNLSKCKNCSISYFAQRGSLDTERYHDCLQEFDFPRRDPFYLPLVKEESHLRIIIERWTFTLGTHRDRLLNKLRDLIAEQRL
jgi:hypothetical protein